MTVVMDRGLQKKLEKVQRREWWPVTLLAEVLGRPRRYVYRMVGAGKFAILNDGKAIKVTSDSVIQYFSEDHHQFQ